MKIVNILGTKYTVSVKKREDDECLKDCDGYCDKTSKRIVVVAKADDSNLDNYDEYLKKITRHEIIHAFLYESGLHENFEHRQWGHDETTVDWIAVQFPKMLKAFEEAECI